VGRIPHASCLLGKMLVAKQNPFQKQATEAKVANRSPLAAPRPQKPVGKLPPVPTAAQMWPWRRKLQVRPCPADVAVGAGRRNRLGKDAAPCALKLLCFS
jgi:hypothetical protein